MTPAAYIRSWTETWDFENRLIKSEQVKGAEKRTVTFKYDPLGRRIQKQLTTVISGVTSTSTWVYVYDNRNIALEIYTDPAGAVEKTWYTHGVEVDEHLALERNGSNFCYHADGLGSVTAVTSGSGNVVESYKYDGFGKIQPGSNFRSSYAYTGREWDKETGLYYYRARYYDPIEGRFVSKDPIGFKGGINLYSYTESNPINRTDPSGEAWNGNVVPGSFPQDNKCSVPATFNFLNNNKCTKQCCKEHDDCYTRYGCNASSWLINGVTTIPVGACQMCNLKAAACILSNLPNKKCDDCK